MLNLTVWTHWGRVTHICISKLSIIGSDNGLSPDRHQAIIWTNAGILSIGNLERNFNEILIAIHTFSFKNIYVKMSSGKWPPFCLGLNVLKQDPIVCIAVCYLSSNAARYSCSKAQCCAAFISALKLSYNDPEHVISWTWHPTPKRTLRAMDLMPFEGYQDQQYLVCQRYIQYMPWNIILLTRLGWFIQLYF